MPSELRKERDRARTERRRQSLLDAAGRVFVRQGFHRTLVSDIAREAQVGQGTFYRHFPDKPSIFLALMDRFVASLFEGFAEMAERRPTSLDEYREASVRAIRHLALHLERNRETAVMLLREAPSVGPEAEQRLEHLYQGLADLARTFLDHAIAEGFATPCDSTLVSQALVAMGTAMAHRWWAGRLAGFSMDQVITGLVDFAFLGISGGILPIRGRRSRSRRRTPGRPGRHP